MKFGLGSEENIVGKGENAGYQHFLPGHWLHINKHHLKQYSAVAVRKSTSLHDNHQFLKCDWPSWDVIS